MRTLSRFVLAASLLLPTVASAEEFAFSDVPFVHPNAEAIEYVKAQGIVEGYADGTFRPGATINRAEFVKILMGTLGDDGPVCKIAPFADVDQDAWYATFAHKARCRGVIEGYSDGTFRPANSVNFVEAAKILVNATYDFEVVESQFDAWYRPYVERLSSEHAIPTSIASFDQPITRGEMAEMIYRVSTMNTTKSSRTYAELAGGGTTTYTDPGLYSISYPASWTRNEYDKERLWLSASFNGSSYVHSGYVSIETPATCPSIPERTIGVVQKVELGSHVFTAFEQEDGAAGTSYDTITFFSQVHPSQCIVITKAIGTLNADPLNDMGDYTPAHAAIRDTERKAAQDVMAKAIKTIVIH